MIDFDLTEADRRIVALAHEQAVQYQKHGLAHDEDRVVGVKPAYLPGEDELLHVRNAARTLAQENSGYAILEALIYLEEIWGLKPTAARGRSADTLNFGLSNTLVEMIGTPEQAQRWRDTSLCWAMTEPAAGSDAAGIRTTAIQDPKTGEWVINGEKIFISLGESTQGVMVMARATDRNGVTRVSNFIVEKGMPGFSVGAQHRKLGQRCSDTVNLIFDNVRVPDFNNLNGNLKSTLAIMNTTRSMVAAQALGYSRAGLDIVREKLAEAGIDVDYYAGHRHQPEIVARLIKAESLWEAVWCSMIRARWIEKVQGAAEKLEAAMSKAIGGSMVRKVTQEAIALLGPLGVLEENVAARMFRDSRIVDIYEGPGEVQRLLIARQLLGYTSQELN